MSISLATPLAEMTYKLGKVSVDAQDDLAVPVRASAQALMPIGVEEFEVTNTLEPGSAGHAR